MLGHEPGEGRQYLYGATSRPIEPLAAAFKWVVRKATGGLVIKRNHKTAMSSFFDNSMLVVSVRGFA